MYQPHQMRVIEERRELNVKLDKLVEFLKGTIFQSLPTDEQERLSRQCGVMQEYSNILAERIVHFEVA